MGANRQRRAETAANAAAESRQVSRRTVLGGLAALGGGALLAPGAAQAAADVAATARWTSRGQEDAKTLVFAADGSPSDLDPQTSNDYRSILAFSASTTVDRPQGRLDRRIRADDRRKVGVQRRQERLDVPPARRRRNSTTARRRRGGGAGVVRALEPDGARAGSKVGPDSSPIRRSRSRRPTRRRSFSTSASRSPCSKRRSPAPMATTSSTPKLMKAHEDDGDWGHAWAQINADGTGTGPYGSPRSNPTSN